MIWNISQNNGDAERRRIELEKVLERSSNAGHLSRKWWEEEMESMKKGVKRDKKGGVDSASQRCGRAPWGTGMVDACGCVWGGKWKKKLQRCRIVESVWMSGRDAGLVWV